jgi:hypothetical protein
MTRTTDPDPQPMKPLGEKVTPAPPPAPEWKPKPGSPGIEVNKRGELRTNIKGPWL